MPRDPAPPPSDPASPFSPWRLTCREYLRLRSRCLDDSLPSSRHFSLALHALICPWCRRYARQLTLLRTWVRTASAPGRQSPEGLTSRARSRLEQLVTTAAKKSA